MDNQQPKKRPLAEDNTSPSVSLNDRGAPVIVSNTTDYDNVHLPPDAVVKTTTVTVEDESNGNGGEGQINIQTYHEVST